MSIPRNPDPCPLPEPRRSSVEPSAVAPSSEPSDCRRSTLSPGWASRRAAGAAVAIAWHQASPALGVLVHGSVVGMGLILFDGHLLSRVQPRRGVHHGAHGTQATSCAP